MAQLIHLTAEVPLEWAGKRLDAVLALLFAEHSRSRLKTWIEQGQVRVEGSLKRPKDKVKGGERIEIQAEIEEQGAWEAENLPLDVLYQDDYLLVINKARNQVVHPAAGHVGGTLLNALLHEVPSLRTLPRAGIVHRLDKDTTGLLVVAKTLEAHTALVAALQARQIERIYQAIVQGVLPSGGSINAPIGRHVQDRKRMAIVTSGKEAISHYRVLEKFRAHTLVQVKLETGRTHQIRVHLAYVNYPILGDKLYGGRPRLPKAATPELLHCIQSFSSQAFHAKQLGLVHPFTKEKMQWESPLPEDMQVLLKLLRMDAAEFKAAR
jgi:23S rRNA pseudouridine1911/1915/1917 synthase